MTTLSVVALTLRNELAFVPTALTAVHSQNTRQVRLGHSPVLSKMSPIKHAALSCTAQSD
ncbi:hypothetical protein [Bradyrhizobium sp. 5.13L]